MSEPVRASSTGAPTSFRFTGRDGTSVAAYRWEPAGPPRGVVQLTHGLGEHLLRYGHLAAALTGAGFAVHGQDHRGHGATVASGAAQGHIGAAGWGELLHDVDLLLTRAHDEHPGLPVVLLGHSMGSFAVQQYLLDRSDRVAAAVLTGTGLLDLLEPALDLSAPLDLALFNAAFVPARTDFDWLSRDEAQVDAYVADPRCGFGLDVEGTRAMFTAARDVADPERLAGIRRDLPVYLAVGDADPVNGQLALVHALVDRYRAAGLGDVTLRVWPGARHEVFNETNRDEVVADLLDWLDRAVPAR